MKSDFPSWIYLSIFIILGQQSFAQNTWTMQNGPGENLWAIAFADELVGVAGGNFGEFYRTIDGGTTWTLDPSITYVAHDIEFVSPTEGWLAAGGIYHTINAGASWTYQQDPANFVSDICMLNGQEGFAISSGELIGTTDGGATWTMLFDFGLNYGLTDVHFIDNQNGWLTVLGGGIWRTYDGGMSWTLQYASSNVEFRCVRMIDTDNGWVGGGTNTCPSFARLWHTTDGGSTWSEEIMDPDMGAVQGIQYQNAGDDIWLAIGSFCSQDRGTVLRSTDAGVLWFEDVLPNDQPVTDIHVLDANNMWTSGHDGQINAYRSDVSVQDASVQNLQVFINQEAHMLTVSGLPKLERLDITLVAVDGRIHPITAESAGLFRYDGSIVAGLYLLRLNYEGRSKVIKFWQH